MFGLAEQIGSANFAVHAAVGDDQGLGRTGQQIDADAAEQDSPWHEYRGRGPITKNQVAALP